MNVIKYNPKIHRKIYLYDTNICHNCFMKFNKNNIIKCEFCDKYICINCLIEYYKQTNKINYRCMFCKKNNKFNDKIIFKIKYESHKINNFCKNCKNTNLYQFNNQIICKDCNTYYCSKCFQQIYPEQIETFNNNIILINNKNFKNYTSEQQYPHTCKEEDINFYNIIKNDYIRCPICNNLHQKDDNSKSIICINSSPNHILEINNNKISNIFKCINNECMEDILTHNKYEMI